MSGSLARRAPIVVLLLPLALTACGSGSPNSATNSTLPPIPPTTIGYVTLIGAASAIGTGDQVEAINLSDSPGGATRTLHAGAFPAAAAVSPDNKTLYVVNYAGNSVTPINIATGKAEKAIPVGTGPAGIAIAPNGKTAYVTNAGTTPIGHTVTPINLKTRQALAPIKVGDGPQGIAITPDGSTAFVANAGGIVNGQNAPLGNTVTPINLKTRTAGAAITVGNAPTAVVATPDGSTIYVANSGSGSVTPITVAGDSPGVPIGVAGSPQALAASTTAVYVTNDSASSPAGNNVTPITASGAGKPIVTGANPTAIALAPGGKTAYVVCNGSGQLLVLDLAAGTVVKSQTTAISGGPYAIALAEVPAAKAAAALGRTTPKKTPRRAEHRVPPASPPGAYGHVPTGPSGPCRSGSRRCAPSRSSWRAPRRAWRAADGCGRRRCARHRSTHTPRPARAVPRG